MPQEASTMILLWFDLILSETLKDPIPIFYYTVSIDYITETI